jgi:hypothetical protein
MDQPHLVRQTLTAGLLTRRRAPTGRKLFSYYGAQRTRPSCQSPSSDLAAVAYFSKKASLQDFAAERVSVDVASTRPCRRG